MENNFQDLVVYKGYPYKKNHYYHCVGTHNKYVYQVVSEVEVDIYSAFLVSKSLRCRGP